MKHLPILLLLVSATACKKSVDAKDFESRIVKRTEELGIQGAKVSCPKGVEAKEGNSIDCKVEIDGKSYVLVSTITKVDGKQLGMDTKWKDGEAVISGKLGPVLTKALGEEFGTEVAIDCGEPLRFLDAERRVTCDLAAGETKAKVAVTFDAKLVPTDWKLEPRLIGKAKLEGLLTKRMQEQVPNATVTCGAQGLFPRPPDGIVKCEAVAGSDKMGLAVEVDEDLQIKRWSKAE